MISTISVLGCGWLGLPLSKFLAAEYKIKGSTTRPDKMELLQNAGVEPYLIKLDPEAQREIDKFLSGDLLIINIPPSLRSKTEDYHIEQMRCLHRRLVDSPVKYIIYISSTSVYPDLRREVTEEDVLTEDQADNKTLFAAEEIFRSDKKFHTTIVRCAGLAGYDRNLVKHFAGKENLKMGNAPVNLIHRDDVIGIIRLIVQKEYWDQTLNICAPEHPLRRDLYPFLAQKYRYPAMSYDLEDSSDYKIISTEKLHEELSYHFIYPNPAEFFYS